MPPKRNTSPKRTHTSSPKRTRKVTSPRVARSPRMKHGMIEALIMSNPQLKTFANAIAAAGLAHMLNGKGMVTVFAPHDEAFARLPPGALEAIMADKTKLKHLIEYHLVRGNVTSARLAKSKHLKTMDKRLPIEVRMEGAHILVNGAHVVGPDMVAKNGRVHVIDQVLMPPMAAEVVVAAEVIPIVTEFAPSEYKMGEPNSWPFMF